MNCRTSRLLLNFLSTLLAVMGIVMLGFTVFYNDDSGVLTGFSFLAFQSEYVEFDWALISLGIVSWVQIIASIVLTFVNVYRLAKEKYSPKLYWTTVIVMFVFSILYWVEGRVFFIFDDGVSKSHIPFIIDAVLAVAVIAVMIYMNKFTEEEKNAVVQDVAVKQAVGAGEVVADNKKENR